MRIFALETDHPKLIRSFLSSDEKIILAVTFSVFLFIVRSLRALILTLIFVSVGIGAAYVGIPVGWTALALFLVWLVVVFFKWLTALIDWLYDVMVVTTEEIILVDQSSIFHVNISQWSLDNVASVSAESQYWNVFPFGKINFELKEGTGKSVSLAYIPHAQKVAAIISDSLVQYERRRAVVASSIAHGDAPTTAEKKADAAAPMPPGPQVVTDGAKPTSGN